MGLTCSVQRRSNEAPFVPGIATRYRRYVAIEHDCLLGTDRALPAPIRQRPAGHSIAGGRPVVETYPCVGRQWLHVIRTGTSLRPTVINSWIPWTPKASAVGPVRCHGVRSCHEIRVPVKVSELNRQRPLSGIGGNLSSCPLRDLRGQLGNWLRCLDCGPSRRSRSGRRPPRERRSNWDKRRPRWCSARRQNYQEIFIGPVARGLSDPGAGSDAGGQKLWMGRAGERYLRCCLRDGFGLTFLAHFKKDGGHDAAPPGARIGREK